MRALSVISTVLILSVFMAIAAFFFGHSSYNSAGPLESPEIVLIESGSGVSQIAARLEQQNVIPSALTFKVATRLTHRQSSLKAGEYEFPANISLRDVLDKLEAGDVILRQITVPEGKTSYEVIQIINAKEDLTNNGERQLTQIPPEGSLLPETYRYQSTDTPESIIARMTSAMVKTLDQAWENRAPNLPIKTKEEALVLASLIEKETGVKDERKRVAGVFVNRINKGMLLQTDPTVIYAITKGEHKNDGKGPLGRRLLTKDLGIDSPYNTYKYAGLPPGPICNPGKASIEAALNPEKHDYLFFVADGTGGHAFGKTNAEHLKNVSKWRKVRKSQ